MMVSPQRNGEEGDGESETKLKIDLRKNLKYFQFYHLYCIVKINWYFNLISSATIFIKSLKSIMILKPEYPDLLSR